ncbi:MAG TPA: RHS repeat-associated core domain-containing protein, partial [Candidatus Dojkabacteria bacterium]|nr:RHS repeat-associated core domain-containing protein [Candidatus Dojkabacteria bacterium]
ARYYDPKISIWLSVDPLAEEFPNFNPYNYVMQNPIKLSDPTGMCPDEGSGDGDPLPVGTVLKGVSHAGDLDEVVVTSTRSKSSSENTHSSQVDQSEVFSFASACATVAKESQYSKTFEIWTGKNGKMYQGLSGRGPNGATGSRGYAKAKAGKIGLFGGGLGLVSIGATEYEYANSLKENYGPNMRRHLSRRRAWDQAANGTGFLGVFGAAGSFGYNLGHLIEGTLNVNIQLNPYTGDFTPIEETLMLYDRLGIEINK